MTAIMQTTTGAIGTLSVSFGTTFRDDRYCFAFEKGTVIISDISVESRTPHAMGVSIVKSFNHQTNGVEPEVARWAEAMEERVQDARQKPDEALKDLCLLEAIFRSGEAGGSVVDPRKDLSGLEGDWVAV